MKDRLSFLKSEGASSADAMTMLATEVRQEVKTERAQLGVLAVTGAFAAAAASWVTALAVELSAGDRAAFAALVIGAAATWSGAVWCGAVLVLYPKRMVAP